MSRVEISVVVPTYGRPEATARAIWSVLAQDADLEVVVVDDGSPTPFVFAEDPRVSVLRLASNSGAAAARNAGAGAARADWLAFLDSDDVWTAASLRPRLDTARSGADLARTIWAAGFVDVWPDGQRKTRIPVASSDPIDFASGCWSCPGSTALMSRTAWDKSGGQDSSLRRLEDYEWLLRWGAAGGRLAIDPTIAAEITRGPRATPEAVTAAARTIRAKHANAAPPLRKRTEGYLQLELAAARLHGGDLPGGASALARSWFLKPRLQAALVCFWTAQARIDLRDIS